MWYCSKNATKQVTKIWQLDVEVYIYIHVFSVRILDLILF